MRKHTYFYYFCLSMQILLENQSLSIMTSSPIYGTKELNFNINNKLKRLPMNTNAVMSEKKKQGNYNTILSITYLTSNPPSLPQANCMPPKQDQRNPKCLDPTYRENHGPPVERKENNKITRT